MIYALKSFVFYMPLTKISLITSDHKTSCELVIEEF